MSKSQIDRLGARLRAGPPSEADLLELTAYREGFASAYARVIVVIRDQLGIEPTGRPAKSTIAIVDKLRRESIRLSQIQDIAGCRVVVADVREQNSTVERVVAAFDKATIVDRRERPTNGYRAVARDPSSR